jgi:hypothetical protein
MLRGIEVDDSVDDLVCDGLSRPDERRETVQCCVDQQRITITELEIGNYRMALFSYLISSWNTPSNRSSRPDASASKFGMVRTGCVRGTIASEVSFWSRR